MINCLLKVIKINSKKVDISIKVLEVLFNIIMLLFFYFSFLGDAGKFTSIYNLENGISLYLILKINIIFATFYFILHFLLKALSKNKFNIKIEDILFCYAFTLGNINCFIYAYETKDNRWFYILYSLIIIRAINEILLFYKNKYY